jgi:hypothetical protein
MTGEPEKELEDYLQTMLQDFESDSEKVKPVREDFVKWCKDNRKKPSEETLEEYFKQRFYHERNLTKSS